MTRFEWTDEKLSLASEMWKSGSTMSQLSERLGASINSVASVTVSRRELFPHRPKKELKQKSEAAPKPAASAPAEPLPPRTDRVPRVTLSGAVVNLARVTFIDGPAP